MIISLLNQKGGVGKTTLAIHLATGIARQKKRVLLIDADPQASSLDWSATREADGLFPVIGLPKPTLHKELPMLSPDYDGADAPKLYQTKNFGSLFNYCMADVRLTKKLFDRVIDAGHIINPRNNQWIRVNRPR